MKICIFGASSNNIASVYIEETEKLAYQLAVRGYSLITGGGRRGLMGAANRGFKKGNAHIISIVPKIINVDGFLFDDYDELIITENMFERKMKMIELADAFIAVPGGTGTLDELFEVYVDNQLGVIRKPLILYNIKGYYDGLQNYLRYQHSEGFLNDNWDKNLLITGDMEYLLKYLEQK